MTRFSWVLTVVVIIAAAGLILNITDSQRAKDTAEPTPPAEQAPRQAVDAGKIGQAPDKMPPPPKPIMADLDQNSARALAASRIEVTPYKSSGVIAWSPASSYGAVAVNWQAEGVLASLFREFYGKPIQSIVVAIQSSGHRGPELPPVPILVMSKSEDGSGKDVFKQVFDVNGRATPYARLSKSGGFKINFSVSFYDRTLERQTLRSLAALSAATEPWSARSAEPILKALEISLKKLEQGIVKSYSRLLEPEIGPSPDGIQGQRMTFSGKDGKPIARLQIEPVLKPSFVSGPNRYAKADDLTSGRLAETNGLLLSEFWLAEDDAFADSCRDLTQALGAEYGFHDFDTATILGSMIRDHAWLADNVDYGTDCLNAVTVKAMNRMNMPIPTGDSVATSSISVGPLNKNLSELAQMLRHNQPARIMPKLRQLFADRVSLQDRANVWLWGEGVIDRQGDRAMPGIGGERAMEQLLSLPITRFGCYSGGEGGAGAHRASLVQLANLDNMWDLEFAFDSAGKIAAVALREASRQAICRATGNRTSGENACYFARYRDRFPAVAAANCGQE